MLKKILFLKFSWFLSDSFFKDIDQNFVITWPYKKQELLRSIKDRRIYRSLLTLFPCTKKINYFLLGEDSGPSSAKKNLKKVLESSQKMRKGISESKLTKKKPLSLVKTSVKIECFDKCFVVCNFLKLFLYYTRMTVTDF